MQPFTPALQAELVGRLVIAVALGSLLGWERQMGRHPAGLRTHMLVALGSAAYTVAGAYGGWALLGGGVGTVEDPGRVAAQIITGVGFLGAGTIWRSSGEENVIRGLTTAASIWVAASIGMLTGYGLYILAAGTAVLSFVVLRVIRQVERAPRAIGSVVASRLRSTRGAAYQPARYPSVVENPPPVPVLDGQTADTTTATLEAEEAVLESVGKRDRLHKKLKKPKKGRRRKHRDLPPEELSQISDEDEPVRAAR